MQPRPRSGGSRGLVRENIECVPELTATDVDEIRRYLTTARTNVLEWLPDLEWSAAWKSEAADELANAEIRRDGSRWGEQPLLWSYASAWLFISAAVDCIDAICLCVTMDTPALVPSALSRVALEAGGQASWLLQPGLGARRRVARRILIHHASARQLTCEGQSLPSATRLASDFAAKIRTPGAYAIWSNAVHAGWSAITADWDPGTLNRTTDRESIWAVAINAAACAMDPCRDALLLLGLNARLAQWSRSHIRGPRPPPRPQPSPAPAHQQPGRQPGLDRFLRTSYRDHRGATSGTRIRRPSRSIRSRSGRAVSLHRQGHSVAVHHHPPGTQHNSTHDDTVSDEKPPLQGHAQRRCMPCRLRSVS